MSDLSNTAMVYISYSRKDQDIVRSLKEFLQREGISVFDDEKVLPGVEWQLYFNQQMSNATVFLPVISKSYLDSPYTARERALAIYINQNADEEMLVLPYVIEDDAQVPFELMGRLYLQATNNQMEDFEKIKNAIVNYSQIRQTQETEKKNVRKKIDKSLSKYLDTVFERLESNRKSYKILAIIAYVFSATFLIIAVVVAKNMSGKNIDNVESAIFIFGSGVILTCVLAALSRMMFILGRSLMVESIRNADRYHAISFGKFYIEAFGNNISKQEVREVLGAWNFDSETNFSKQDAKEIDPNLMAFFEKINISSK